MAIVYPKSKSSSKSSSSRFSGTSNDYTNAFNNMMKKLNTGKQYVAGKGVVSVNTPSSSSNQINSQVNSLSKKTSRGGGSSGGSSSVSSYMTPYKPLGTTGNPAGSQSPTGSGTALATNREAKTAASVGVPEKKNQNLLARLASGIGGAINKGVNYVKDTFDGTGNKNYYTAPNNGASAFDAFQVSQQNRVNKDLEVGGLQTASGNGVSSSYKNLMTQSSGGNFPNNPVPQVDYQELARQSAPLVQSTPKVSSNSANTASVADALQRTQKSGSSSRTSTQSSPQSSFTLSTSTNIPTVTPEDTNQSNPVSKVNIDNTVKQGPSTTEIQAAAGIADETRKQAEAASQAAQTAQTDEDRAYYQKLADDAMKEADQAQAEYEKLLQTSEEEKALQAQIDNELSSLNLGKEDIAGQPIALGFIGGQQAALERRSLLRTQPLQSKLGQLQAARNAALNAAKYKAGVSEDRYGRSASNLESYTAEQRKRNQQLEDKATERANDRTTLSPGQVMFDSKGNIVASVPNKASSSTQTPSGVKANTYKDAQQIPVDLRNSLLDDIVMNQGNLPDIIAAYPEISPNVVQDIFNRYSVNGTGLNKTSSREI